MNEYGFVRGEHEMMLLILFALGRLSKPVDMSTLYGLIKVDDSVNYFEYCQCLSSLINTEHIIMDEHEGYAITDKGRKNLSVCEKELAFSVRRDAAASAEEYDRILRRGDFVHAAVTGREGGGYTVSMSLNDEQGIIMELSILSPTLEQAEKVRKSFVKNPEKMFDRVMAAVIS